MGADLIGIMFVGPTQFTKEQKDKAAEIYTSEKKRLLDLVGEKIDDDGSRYYDALHEDDANLRCALHSFANADDFIEDLLGTWEGRYRDVYVRPYNDKKIVFAGDRSYGDTPEGAGYATLLALACLPGIDDVLGLE
jgi:hypothetical protein